MNILITSAGNKVPLIECLKRVVKFPIKIIASDMNENNLAKFFADEFLWIPSFENIRIENFVSICKKRRISYILPTRESDLIFFASYKKLLEKEEIFVLVSSLEGIEKVSDKFKFYQTLHAQNIQVITTFLSTEGLGENMKYVVKERYGAGSKNLFVNLSKKEVEEVIPRIENPIIQPYIQGKEYSIDLYVTRTKKIKATVVRERQLVLDGESQITVIVEHPNLSNLISKAALILGLEGHIMFQAFEDVYGDLWIIECNARIGGASTLSIYAGLDSFNWWIAECDGENIENWPVEIRKLKQIRCKKDIIL